MRDRPIGRGATVCATPWWGDSAGSAFSVAQRASVSDRKTVSRFPRSLDRSDTRTWRAASRDASPPRRWTNPHIAMSREPVSNAADVGFLAERRRPRCATDRQLDVQNDSAPAADDRGHAACRSITRPWSMI
jgi:hypothetical protein